MSSTSYTMESPVTERTLGISASTQVAPQALVHDVHPQPTEEQITRVVFFVIMAASVLFIAATLFVTHM